MTTFTQALSAVLGTVVQNAMFAEEKRIITEAAKREELIITTSARMANTGLKAQSYRATSPQHAALFDASMSEIQKRLDALNARRNPAVNVIPSNGAEDLATA